MQNGRASGNSEFSSEFLRYARAPREETADELLMDAQSEALLIGTRNWV